MYLQTLSILGLALSAFAAPVHLAPIKRAAEIPDATQAKANSYIVMFNPNTVAQDKRIEWITNVLATANIEIPASDFEDLNKFKLKWDAKLYDGFAGTLSDEAVEIIRAQPEVASLWEDLEMYVTEVVTQTNAPWGIARFSSGQSLRGRDPALLNFNYVFDDANTGQNSDVYIIDTGIRADHVDFGGRATALANFGSGTPGVDVNGHGTHCAGSAAGSVFGIAKSASIFGIKVMADDGSGATSDIISGINVAIQRAVSTGRPSVISMSLGGPTNAAIDTAVGNGIAQGIPFIVAAGNETRDASLVSPARLAAAITVGATTINDEVAFFSNFGSAVDIFAPGDAILSAAPGSQDALASLSGTSMATPQVAGLALTILQNERLSPAALKTRLIELAQAGTIGKVPGGTVNELAKSEVQAR